MEHTQASTKTMNRLSLTIFALCSPFLCDAQTISNVPFAPMPTMGADQAYSVPCKICGREQVLIPLNIKVITVKADHMGELQSIECTFKCLNPKCGKKFVWTTPRWLRAPMQLAPASPMRLTPTNAIPSPTPKEKLKSPKSP